MCTQKEWTRLTDNMQHELLCKACVRAHLDWFDPHRCVLEACLLKQLHQVRSTPQAPVVGEGATQHLQGGSSRPCNTI